MAQQPLLYRSNASTPIGRLPIVTSDAGLVAVLWPDDTDGRVKLASEPRVEPEHPTLLACAAQLDEYFAGDRRTFDLPLDLGGTAFQLEAWHALAAIPYGQTATYAEQAERLGRPNAYRAVGTANGKNPVSIVLPCHRVIASNGSLAGFAGGLDAKRFLLDHEAR